MEHSKWQITGTVFHCRNDLLVKVLVLVLSRVANVVVVSGIGPVVSVELVGVVLLLGVVSISVVEHLGISLSLSLGQVVGVYKGLLVLSSISHGGNISLNSGGRNMFVLHSLVLNLGGLVDNGRSVNLGGGVDHGGVHLGGSVDIGSVNLGVSVNVGHGGLVDFSVSLGSIVHSLGGLNFGGLLGGNDAISIVFHMVDGLSHGKSQK